MPKKIPPRSTGGMTGHRLYGPGRGMCRFDAAVYSIDSTPAIGQHQDTFINSMVHKILYCVPGGCPEVLSWRHSCQSRNCDGLFTWEVMRCSKPC